MPFCANCGSQIEGQFCGSCGKPVGASQSVAAAPAAASQFSPAVAPASAGMADNVASLLCYLCGLVTGIIFLALAPYNQNKAIRFHAFQSIFLSAAWFAVFIVERVIDAALLSISLGLVAMVALVWTVVGLGFVVLWVVLMVKAYQGQRWKLPVIGDLAEKQA
jgi:uncharacterized membrane protein